LVWTRRLEDLPEMRRQDRGKLASAWMRIFHRPYTMALPFGVLQKTEKIQIFEAFLVRVPCLFPERRRLQQDALCTMPSQLLLAVSSGSGQRPLRALQQPTEPLYRFAVWAVIRFPLTSASLTESSVLGNV
jgi:hypothetical protein